MGLEGSLLIAHPNLLDPNFRRTVLFMVTHDAEEGAMGLVLNRPTKQTVDDLLMEPEFGPLGQVPVFWGGPVSTDRMTFAAFRWKQQSQSVECRINIELDEAKELALEGEGVVRAFVGYAGWSRSQLEGELDQKAWVVQKADREVLDPEECKQMWQTIMKNYGPWFRLLAQAPDDPSQN